MATNIELKQSIDTNIINKTAPSSITKANVGNMGKGLIDYVDQEISNVQEPIPGPAGQQGIQGNPGSTGPQGNPGPIGPAGLTWKGQWVSGSSYLKDDAVGHNGASWFCIANTSGVIPPNSDITNWALLASQGAQGIQGATGLTGAQGETGPQGPAGDYEVNTFEILESTTTQSPHPFSNAKFVKFTSYQKGYSLPAPSGLGDVKYVRTLFENTLWPSASPYTDGANINFLTPDGNGNVQTTLQANKMYRFTYVGKFGGTYGFWTIEIMNNIY